MTDVVHAEPNKQFGNAFLSQFSSALLPFQALLSVTVSALFAGLLLTCLLSVELPCSFQRGQTHSVAPCQLAARCDPAPSGGTLQ